jgi:hypothetical protein
MEAYYLKKALVLVILAFTCAAVWGEISGDWEYRVFGAAEGRWVIITRYRGAEKAVRVPKEIDGFPVTIIGDYAFNGAANISSVTIQQGLTAIGNRAFWSCTALSELRLPEGLRIIGREAFRNCTSLREIDLPSGLINLGDEAFNGCTSLVRVALPDSLTGLSVGTFFNCEALETVQLPAAITRIEAYAFSGCSRLSTVAITGTISAIGEYAFFECRDFLGFTLTAEQTQIIPAGLQSIGERAFSGCSSITEILLPSSVEVIGKEAISSCPNLRSISVAPGNSRYSDADGVLFDSGKTRLILYPQKRDGAYVVPDGVLEIAEEAFKGCSLLSQVTLPSSAAAIGPRAFQNCSALADIRLPGGIKTIDREAFSGCRSLGAFTLSGGGGNFLVKDGVLFDRSGALLIRYPQAKAGRYQIPQGVTAIGDGAFYGCEKLEDILLGSGLGRIGSRAFEDCTALTEAIQVPDTVSYIGDRAFAGCTGLRGILVPLSVTHIGSRAFNRCTSLSPDTREVIRRRFGDDVLN